MKSTKVPINHTADQSRCAHDCACHSSFLPKGFTHRLSMDIPKAQSAPTSAFDAFLFNLFSRSRLCASIQLSSTLPSITVVSGTTRLSTRNLQNLLWPIWACKQLQHCELGTTCGGSGGVVHFRPIATDSAHRVTMAAVRAWPQEWAVAWVVWHISLNEVSFRCECWRGVSQALLQQGQMIGQLSTLGLAVRLSGGT